MENGIDCGERRIGNWKTCQTFVNRHFRQSEKDPISYIKCLLFYPENGYTGSNLENI